MTRAFQRIAIVNRGEAAVRFVRALRDYNRERGTSLVAIALYTDPDQQAPFVRLADEAYPLGPALRHNATGALVSAYTDLDHLMRTLELVRAEAVWPGWGFVAENASFVEMLENRDITFIGPPSSAMRRLGDKIAAKKVATAAKVPMAPWHLVNDGESLDVTETAATRIGYPLVVKASAGGGGRGIRVVKHRDELAPSLASVADEVRRSFGGGGIFLESCVTAARHIEVQLVVGANGRGRTLGIRDCSIQRKHQKVIEEAPSPVVGGALSQRLQDAAVRLGEEVGYRGVGTVEFLVDPSRDFAHFLEVNTRLQVEHTVTELVTGVDLVQVQIDIARGLPWDELQPPEPTRGHAIEVRLNAEDPERNFTPSPGVVRVFKAPLGPGIRIDSGIAEGVAIAPEFDSMIAKLMAHGRDRNQAMARLLRALRELELVVEDGTSNKAFLVDLLQRPEVISGSADTGWLDRVGSIQTAHPLGFEALCATAILVRREAIARAAAGFHEDVQDGIPWPIKTAPSEGISLSLRGQSATFEAHALGADRFLVGPSGSLFFATFTSRGPGQADLTLHTLAADRDVHAPDGGQAIARRHEVLFAHGKTGFALDVDGTTHRVELASGGKVAAPAPALVVALHVAEGDEVSVGMRLATLEAMKMEVPVIAKESGRIGQVLCRVNEQVQAGQALMRIEGAGGKKDESTLACPTPPRPLARLVDPEAESRVLDPRRLDTLSEVDAAETVERLFQVVRARLLGWEVPPAALADAEFLLAQEDLFRQVAEPARWRKLAELLSPFSDLEQIFEQLLDGPELPGPVRAEHLFFAHCRALGVTTAPTHPAFEVALGRALRHYGIDRTDKVEDTPATREAFYRMAVAHADEHRHALLNSVLRALLALHQAGCVFAENKEIELWLVRIAETARSDRPMLRDNARQARYLFFRREKKSLAQDRPTLAMQLARLANPDDPDDEDLEPEDVVDELMPAIYGPDATVRAVPHGLGVIARSVIGEGGVRSLAVVLSTELLGRAAYALQPAFASLGAGGRFELHVVLTGPPQNTSDANELVAQLPTSPEVTRIALTWPDGKRLRHRSWVTSGHGLTHERWLDDVHPERARRMELWRLDGFEIERLETEEALSSIDPNDAPGDPGGPILAFRIQAKVNPRDERIIVYAELDRAPRLTDEPVTRQPSRNGDLKALRELDFIFSESLRIIREAQARRKSSERYFLNRLILHIAQPVEVRPQGLLAVARRLEGATRGHGLQKVVVRAKVLREGEALSRVLTFAMRGRHRLEVHESLPSAAPIRAASDYHIRVERARRIGAIYPYETIRALLGTIGADAAVAPHPDLERSGASFTELDLDVSGERLIAVERGPGENTAAVVIGLVTHPTRKHPNGMMRVFIASDPTMAMGALAEPECRRILCAIDLAEARRLPIEWLPVSSGAKIAMDSGTENLDWTARVLRKLIEFTQRGGEVNIIVAGVNVGAQSYWNAEATMLMHTRGLLIQTPDGSMVLTGKKALEVSGSVAAEDERGIGGFERIMGKNGQAQVFARNLGDAYRILFDHYDFTYVAPGEQRPPRLPTKDPFDRSILESRYEEPGSPPVLVGDLFSDETNPGRKRPFAIREVMKATIDQDGGYLERFAAMEGAETAAVWDAHLGGHPVCLIGFESKNLPRRDKPPLDGPNLWTGGTLFPQSSKKVARAINQASGNRPVVVLANLSGFDGSPESMRKLQLEYGAEIGRAVVNFKGPIVFLVIGRYHGGAYVVFSKALNEELVAMAVEGAYASVIGGAPAAAVVFPREVRARTQKDPRIVALRKRLDAASESDKKALQDELETALTDVLLEHQGKLAAEFDKIHDVNRAVAVGSLDAVIPPSRIRPALIEVLDKRLR